MRTSCYIPSPKHWKEMYISNFRESYWTPKNKVPIEYIKIDRKKFAFDNQISKSQVYNMLVNFDRSLWMPIIVDNDYFLLDGQHRLSLAEQLGLKYIDLIIQDTELLERAPKKTN